MFLVFRVIDESTAIKNKRVSSLKSNEQKATRNEFSGKTGRHVHTLKEHETQKKGKQQKENLEQMFLGRMKTARRRRQDIKSGKS